MFRSSTLAMVLALAIGATHAEAPERTGHDVYGVWLTEARSAKVRIEDCGDGTPCGEVVWLDPTTLREGLTPAKAVDENNPDPALRTRPIIGMIMLSDFDKKRKDWRNGTIYDAEVGKSYGSRLKRLENGDLQVKGCLGPICQTQVWTRSVFSDGKAG